MLYVKNTGMRQSSVKTNQEFVFIECFVLYSNAEHICDCLYFCVIVTNRVVIFVTVKELVNYSIIINTVCLCDKKN
jgi:hypothetical protein